MSYMSSNSRLSLDSWAYTLKLIDVPVAQSFKIYQTVLNTMFYSRNGERDDKHEGWCLWRIKGPLNWCILRMWYIIIKWTWHRPLEYGWARIQSVLNLWSGYAKSPVKLSVWEHQHDQTGDMSAGVQCVCQSVCQSGWVWPTGGNIVLQSWGVCGTKTVTILMPSTSSIAACPGFQRRVLFSVKEVWLWEI